MDIQIVNIWSRPRSFLRYLRRVQSGNVLKWLFDCIGWRVINVVMVEWQSLYQMPFGAKRVYRSRNGLWVEHIRHCIPALSLFGRVPHLELVWHSPNKDQAWPSDIVQSIHFLVEKPPRSYSPCPIIQSLLPKYSSLPWWHVRFYILYTKLGSCSGRNFKWEWRLTAAVRTRSRYSRRTQQQPIVFRQILIMGGLKRKESYPEYGNTPYNTGILWRSQRTVGLSNIAFWCVVRTAAISALYNDSLLFGGHRVYWEFGWLLERLSTGNSSSKLF